MSNCQFTNSYSTEILAFEQLKFWPEQTPNSDKISV